MVNLLKKKANVETSALDFININHILWKALLTKKSAKK
jgi:hypothetical protein